MITKNNLKEVLEILNFNSKDKIVYEKFYQNSDKISIKVDFDKKTIDYLPFDNRFKSDILPSIDNPSVGFMAHRETTLNFKDEKAKEVFVDLIAVDKLLEKGYKPEHIVLEPEFKTGHGDKAYGDILVLNENFENLLLIECKTTTSDINKSEFNKEWQNMLENGGQLISYQGVRKSKFLCLLSFDLEENQILTYNYIISMLDDENGKKAEKNYLNSSDKEAIFKVWKELYNQNYEEAGIFEPSMQAYNIGFEKPTIDILKPLVNRDIDEKRSKWDDELRAHSVNDRNLALAKLMNLFLCKITDELENPNDLQFYWYGDEADNAYKLIDRLQNLFKKGMEKYLNQKITYHSSKSIQNAFSDDFKGIEVQKKIEEIFKELKYFQNGDFNFIEVFNKELFEKNFEVLLPIVKSLQNVKFTQIEDANVLGHYFECFINDMPQHEGQYFTPMPLANFMIYSLPILKDIKMLDYACGVGHFITQFFNFHKDKKDSITALGVEKDTRLAKTSKIATFMNNVSAEIKAQNALKTGIIQNHNFSYLLCNPPYSVDEFLKVLDEKSRNDFELFNKDLNIATNSIECFFIEKASKVLETNALMAIIVPSSVLGKSGIYERTREILLRDFRIISICEFGSETFYKTGTNVNVIFAIRKAINNTTSINKAEIFSDFYKLILENNVSKARKAYKSFDEYLAKYCDFMNYDIKGFNELLELEENTELFESENFKEYKNAYEALLKKEKAEYDKKSTSYKVKNSFSPSQSLAEFSRKIEAKKFLNYAQICFDEVLIIKAPNDSKEQKTFLGYEYKDNKKAKKRGLQVIGSSLNDLKDIQTPLYNPSDMLDESKLNYYILMNFLKNIDKNLLDKDFAKRIKNSSFTLPDELSEFATLAPLSTLIDFKRAEFSNAINISLATATAINPFENSKFELVRLEKICEMYQPKTITSAEILDKGDYKVYGANGVIGYYNEYNHEFEEVALTCRGATCGTVNLTEPKSWITGNAMIVTPLYNDKVLKKFLFYILPFADMKLVITGSAQPQITRTNLSQLKIPLPPLDIQKQIVAECEEIEKQYQSIRMSIDEYKELIKAVLVKSGVINENGGGYELNSSFIFDKALLTLIDNLPTPQDYNLTEWKNKNLREIKGLNFNPSKSEISKLPLDTKVSFVEMASVSNNGYIENKIDKTLEEVKGSYTYFIENDIILAKITPCM
ncbi:restriction endonuclease subunit S, partial [Campylobacter sp.]